MVINGFLKFDPERDTELAHIPQRQNADEEVPDIDASLFHSEEHGFYLLRHVVQIRRDGAWETAMGNEECLAKSRFHRRCLRTIRPLTRAQAIRMILESYLPEQEGMREVVIGILTTAGIIDQA